MEKVKLSKGQINQIHDIMEYYGNAKAALELLLEVGFDELDESDFPLILCDWYEENELLKEGTYVEIAEGVDDSEFAPGEIGVIAQVHADCPSNMVYLVENSKSHRREWFEHNEVVKSDKKVTFNSGDLVTAKLMDGVMTGIVEDVIPSGLGVRGLFEQHNGFKRHIYRFVNFSQKETAELVFAAEDIL